MDSASHVHDELNFLWQYPFHFFISGPFHQHTYLPVIVHTERIEMRLLTFFAFISWLAFATACNYWLPPHDDLYPHMPVSADVNYNNSPLHRRVVRQIDDARMKHVLHGMGDDLKAMIKRAMEDLGINEVSISLIHLLCLPDSSN